MLCVLFGLILIFVITVLMGESYEIISKTHKGTDTKAEVKKLFGKKLSEASINSKSFYDGEFKAWHLFKKNLIRVEGQYKNGFVHGEQIDYNRNGKIIMKRIWDEGKLLKVFLPENGSFKELSENKWPKYAMNPNKEPIKTHKN